MISALTISFLAALYTYILSQNEATLLFAGDAMMHQSQIDAARQTDGTYDYTYCFQNVKPYISEADFAIVNLECPLGGKPYAGYPCFCAPDEYVDALSDAGFDLFLTANNHTLDRRDKGLKRTIEVLDKKGLPHIGTYANPAQRDSVLPMIFDVKGIKVGFLNYTYGTNGIQPQGEVVVDYIDRGKIKKDMVLTREAGAELLCVAMHWGDEYHLKQNKTQESLAHFLIDNGADMVIGGHPHVVQPMEILQDTTGRKKFIIYSLGNFISGMKTRDTRGGAMLKLIIGRDLFTGPYIDEVEYKLVFTVPGSRGGKNFQLVYADSCADATWRLHSQAFAKEAHRVLSSH